MRPNRKNSQGKIDGMVALVMAYDRLLRAKPKKSKYEDQGIEFI
jgi:phage terminase large subunit-like protein